MSKHPTAAERRKRYAEDPEYAEHCRQLSAKYRDDPAKRAKARERAKQWREQNAERYLQWRKANKERLYALHRAWRERHRHEWFKGHPKGADHYRWRGDEVKYAALHNWLRKHLGKPTICAHCNKEGAHHDWANVDHKYRRVAEDYLRLCESCHYKYDVEHGLRSGLDHSAGGLASQVAKRKRKMNEA
jgi:hypothetical protein